MFNIYGVAITDEERAEERLGLKMMIFRVGVLAVMQLWRGWRGGAEGAATWY